MVSFRGAGTAALSGAADGEMAGRDVIEVHRHVRLDGRELFTSVERQSVANPGRTGRTAVGRRTR
jgi:hypothetical protein